jgi:uncharacterized protein YycO
MIALYRGISPLSRAIRVFTRTDYSHAAWICADGTCIEAWWPGGVRHRPDPYAGHTPGTTIDFFGIRGLEENAARQVEWFLMDKLGAGYDLGGVLRFLTRRRNTNPNRWFCSELVLAALEYAGKTLLKAPAHEVAPGHIAWSTETVARAREVHETEWRRGLARELCRGFRDGTL